MGPNGVTEKAIVQAADVLARLEPGWPVERCQGVARAVIEGVREHLVQRHLYDSAVRELRGLPVPTDQPDGGLRLV